MIHGNFGKKKIVVNPEAIQKSYEIFKKTVVYEGQHCYGMQKFATFLFRICTFDDVTPWNLMNSAIFKLIKMSEKFPRQVYCKIPLLPVKPFRPRSHCTVFVQKRRENLLFGESVHIDMHKNATKTEVFENAIERGCPLKRRLSKTL